MTTTPVKTPPSSDKKDVQKLQRAIVDGLEDVKAQDIQVFDTEQVTALFERVIIASGTSNRQTKALAASVRDSVRQAGFANPRVEGEENGEWIIVDCGAAVAHIMQPVIRQYYHLEELWGDKPVKIKLGAAAPVARKAAAAETQPAVRPAARKKPAAASAKAVAAKKAPRPLRAPDSSYVGRVGKTNDWTATRNATETANDPASKPSRGGATVKTAAGRAAPKKTAAKSSPGTSAGTTVKAPVKTSSRTVAKTVRKPTAKKAPARKTPSAGR
jgi:ribosome-associated protein